MSEVYTFECPKTIEGHDMSQCTDVEIHFLNVGRNGVSKSGFYTAKDFKADGENVVCTWPIDHNATGLVGSLNFLVVFKCKEDDHITYAWHTDVFREIRIAEGINADERFENDYVDVIDRWKDSVMNHFTAELAAWKARTVNEVKAEISERIDLLSTYVTPEMFGAKGDGVTDDTEAFQAAVDSGKRILVPDGIYNVSNINVNRETLIDGNGDKSVIATMDNGFVLNNALVRKVFKNLKFDCSNGSAITVNAEADTVATNTLRIEGCAFEATKNAGLYAIKLFGENEANIFNCSFYGCNGLFVDSSINPNVANCVFRHSDVGIMYAHTGDVTDNPAYTCGLRVSGTTMLGCGIGIKALYADSLQIDNCMIDYCDNPLILVGQSGAFVSNTFISSRFDNPAIYACSNNNGTGKYGGNGKDTTQTEKLTIVNCTILTHVEDYATSVVSAIVLHECLHSIINNTQITWFTEDGIQLNDCSHTSLMCLHIACDSRMSDRSKTYAINSYVKGKQEDDSSNHYVEINSELPIFYHYAKIRCVSNGYGFSDEVRGSVVVTSGKTSHTVNVNTPVVGAVATLSNPNYSVAVSFAEGGGTVTFTFDRTLEVNIRINYIIYCTR